MPVFIYFVLSLIIAALVRPRMPFDPAYRLPSGFEHERMAFGNESFFEREERMNKDSMQRMLRLGMPFAVFIHMIWVGMGVLLVMAPDVTMALIAAVLGGCFLGVAWRTIDVGRARRAIKIAGTQGTAELNPSVPSPTKNAIAAGSAGSRVTTAAEREPLGSPPCKISYELSRGWRTLPESTGRILTVEHFSGQARVTFSAGPYGRPEGEQREFRAEAVRDYLQKGVLPSGSPGRIPASKVLFVRTDLPLAGEANAVRAHYVNLDGDLAGFISLFHGGFEHTIQWTTRPALEREIEEIVESFRFEEGTSSGTA